MKGVVVAAQPVAVEEGARVLEKGGNAMDAAATAAFVQMVADPQMGGIGGHGMMNVFWRGSNDHFMLTFQTEAPALATDTMFTPEYKDIAGGFYLARDNENQIGYKAVGVPGTLKGIYQAMEKYGSMPWKDVIMPAVKIARKGIQIHDDWYQFLMKAAREGEVDHKTRLQATAECARIFLKNGEFHRPGDILRLNDYARTLEKIANEGPDVFTRGEIAEIIEEDFSRNGGILTKSDLDDYQPQRAKPVEGTYRGYKIYTSPFPGAGVLLLFMLNILEGYDLEQMGTDSSEYIHLLAKTQEIVFSKRAEFWGDPNFSSVPVDQFVSKTYADECRKIMEAKEVAPAFASGFSEKEEDTTHVTAVDKAGNAVSFTHSLGVSSGVVTPGLGFIFNNGMCRFDPRPGYPNSVAPRKRRPSNNLPTMVFKEDQPAMVLGASGGFGIIDGVLQTILNVIDHKMELLNAVSAPRIHCENNRIVVENRITKKTCTQLIARGYHVERSPFSYGWSFGNVQAVLMDWDRDKVAGASCPRRGGIALYAD